MSKLSEIVDIRSGYTFRVAVDSFRSGNTEVIQAKDLGTDFESSKRPKIKFPGEVKHLLVPGDILVSARGTAKAKIYSDKDAKAVASSSLFVLRPKKDSVSPEFITMFFNSAMGIKSVFELSSGASVQ